MVEVVIPAVAVHTLTTCCSGGGWKRDRDSNADQRTYSITIPIPIPFPIRFPILIPIDNTTAIHVLCTLAIHSLVCQQIHVAATHWAAEGRLQKVD